MKKRSKKWIMWLGFLLILVAIVVLAFSSNSNDDENGRRTVKVKKEKCYICKKINATDLAKIKGRLRTVCRECHIKGLSKGTIRPRRQEYRYRR